MSSTDQKTIAVHSDQQVNLSSPKAALDFAHEIKEIVVKGKLYDTIQGKNYVNVEGWQLAGALVGYSPLLTKLEDLSDGKQTKYRAEVKLTKVSDGSVIGYGVAICSNKEAKKSKFDEFAIASMAQTRAVGKAYRLSIGWLMKLAGYEPTPSEETISKPTKDAETKEQAQEGEIVDDTSELEWINSLEEGAVEQINSCKTLDELLKLWSSPQIAKVRSSRVVQDAKDKRKAELGGTKK